MNMIEKLSRIAASVSSGPVTLGRISRPMIAAVPFAACPRRQDEILLGDRLGRAAHDAEDARRGDQPGQQDDREVRRADHEDEDQHQDQRGDRHHHVGDAAQHGVERSAAIPREHPQRPADGERHDDREGGQEQHRAAAVEDPAQHVTSELIRAEPVLGRRRIERQTDKRGRRVGRDEWPKNRHRPAEQEQHEPDLAGAAAERPAASAIARPRSDGVSVVVAISVPSLRASAGAARRAARDHRQ